MLVFRKMLRVGTKCIIPLECLKNAKSFLQKNFLHFFKDFLFIKYERNASISFKKANFLLLGVYRKRRTFNAYLLQI